MTQCGSRKTLGQPKVEAAMQVKILMRSGVLADQRGVA
jgi:hypothetical protein